MPPFIISGINDTIIIATCLPLIGRSCEDITCSESEVCFSVTELAERAAQCVLSQNVISLIPETCATLQCDEGSVCVDLQINGFPVRGSCLETNCANSSNNTVCDSNSVHVHRSAFRMRNTSRIVVCSF